MVNLANTIKESLMRTVLGRRTVPLVVTFCLLASRLHGQVQVEDVWELGNDVSPPL